MGKIKEQQFLIAAPRRGICVGVTYAFRTTAPIGGVDSNKRTKPLLSGIDRRL